MYTYAHLRICKQYCSQNVCAYAKRISVHTWSVHMHILHRHAWCVAKCCTHTLTCARVCVPLEHAHMRVCVCVCVCTTRACTHTAFTDYPSAAPEGGSREHNHCIPYKQSTKPLVDCVPCGQRCTRSDSLGG